MKFHNITNVDMLNGDGLRTVLWVSGCELRCHNCQNPQTWDPDDGVEFNEEAISELYSYLKKDYIKGLTLSGGHPLHEKNVKAINDLIDDFREVFPDKTIWLYTGYTVEEILYNFISNPDNEIDKLRYEIFFKCDVVVDGRYVDELKDETYHWAGSTNQRVIDTKAMHMLMDDYLLTNTVRPNNKETFDKIVSKFIILHDNNKRKDDNIECTRDFNTTCLI